jgi:SAM-dependent methyltransferase
VNEPTSFDDPDGPLLYVPEDVTCTAIRSFGAYFAPLNKVDQCVLGRDHVNPLRYLKNIEVLNQEVPVAGKKLLEIGCGFGISLALMLKRFEVDAYGIEPASDGFGASYVCARRILACNHLDPSRILDATGEAIPFPDATFDIVYSNNVLEHTADPAKVLSEALRVLKPGGRLFVEAPNYLSFFEGHYLIPQPPILWHGMLPLWVRFFYRRDPSFARSLRTEINPIWIRKTLRAINRVYAVNIHSLGEDRFLRRLAQPFVFQTEALAGITTRAMKVFQRINRRNWLGRAMVRFQAHYPIVLVATRC